MQDINDRTAGTQQSAHQDDCEEDNDDNSYTLPKRNLNVDDLSSSESDSDSANDDIDYEVIGDKEGKNPL